MTGRKNRLFAGNLFHFFHIFQENLDGSYRSIEQGGKKSVFQRKKINFYKKSCTNFYKMCYSSYMVRTTEMEVRLWLALQHNEPKKCSFSHRRMRKERKNRFFSVYFGLPSGRYMI